MEVDSMGFLEERIGKDNPFTPIYLEPENNIERVLNLGHLGEFQPPRFGEALRLYLAQTFGSFKDGSFYLSKLAGVDPHTSLFSHILNESGIECYRGEKGRHPRMDFQRFFRAAQRPSEEQIEKLGEEYREFAGRIPVLFYERKTGRLSLDTSKVRKEDYSKAVGLAKTDYLGRHLGVEMLYSTRYINRLLRSKKSTYFKHKQNKISGNSKMSSRFLRVEDELGLVPVYFVPPIRDLEGSERAIESHLRSIMGKTS